MQKMQTANEDTLFRGSDLYLSAFLLTRGLRLWTTDDHDPARVIFVLTSRPHPDDLADYVSGVAMANVQCFGRALRRLKAALHGRA